jgi:hypothetical protein
MRIRLCLLAVLCLPCTASNAGEDDTRTVVQLAPPQRAMVLAEMRQFLSGLQQVAQALARDDMETVARVTRPLGSPMTQHMDPALRAALPESFRKLGFSVHADFDRIALDAEGLGDPQHTLSQLGETLAKCVACHDAYQIRAGEDR